MRKLISVAIGIVGCVPLGHAIICRDVLHLVSQRLRQQYGRAGAIEEHALGKFAVHG